MAVANPAPKRRTDPRGPEPPSHFYNREVAGLLIIAVIILIVTLARYWHNIAWGTR
jgi:hypothetical protein